MTWYCLKSTWPSLSMKIKIGSIGSSNFPQSQSIAGAIQTIYMIAHSGQRRKGIFMNNKEFTEQIEPMVMEIIKYCLTTTPEAYKKFKLWWFEKLNETPGSGQFAKDLIDYIDKYRTTVDERVLKLFSIMDECDCDMDVAALLLQDEIEETVK